MIRTTTSSMIKDTTIKKMIMEAKSHQHTSKLMANYLNFNLRMGLQEMMTVLQTTTEILKEHYRLVSILAF